MPLTTVTSLIFVANYFSWILWVPENHKFQIFSKVVYIWQTTKSNILENTSFLNPRKLVPIKMNYSTVLDRIYVSFEMTCFN